MSLSTLASLCPSKSDRKAGFLHPLIHLGYAIEFSQPLLGAEALASTAVHDNWPGAVTLPAEKLAREKPRSPSTTLASLVQRCRADPVISTAVTVEDAPNKLLSGLMPRAGSRLIPILADYTVTPDELPRKTAEMINNAIYNSKCFCFPRIPVSFLGPESSRVCCLTSLPALFAADTMLFSV